MNYNLITGTGAWVLQDGPYSYSDFTKSFEEYDIQRVMRAYENSITINMHCCSEGDWTQDHINKEQYSEFCQVIKVALSEPMFFSSDEQKFVSSYSKINI